jgi:hypothetical protein
LAYFRQTQEMSSFIQPECRPSTEEEVKRLEWLLTNSTSDAKQYVSRIADLNVVAKCTCGCPTVYLALGGLKQRKTGPSTILADFVEKTPEDVEVGVIVHAREGEISELEVYAIPDWKGPFSLPNVESLKQF